MRISARHFAASFSLAFLVLPGCQSTATMHQKSIGAHVVFVCEHGNVKSLISASAFNLIAAQRGLPFHAISRGLHPESTVPPQIVDAMHREGVEVAEFVPQQLTLPDVTGASRVVGIGVDLSSFEGKTTSPIDAWNDVPPASVDYAASRAALVRHINELLDELVTQH